MQKNASGAANTEIINRSGTIETTRGDITIHTGHLLNEADGLTISQSERDYPDAIPAADEYYFAYDLNGRRSDFVISLAEWTDNPENIVWSYWGNLRG